MSRGVAYLFIAVLALAGVATLLGFFGRIYWLIELTAHFRAQYFWMLAMCALGLTALKRPRWALASAVLATVNLSLIVPLYFGPAPPAADRPLCRVMSLNVFWHNPFIDRTLDYIESQRPDVLLLLEVTPQWAVRLRELEEEYPYGRSIPREDSGGLALYSRIPLDHLEIKDPGEQELPTIVAQLKVDGHALTIIGTHPASPTTRRNSRYRNRQLMGVGHIARGQAGAVMVLGDLNITSWSPYFADLLSESGLSDSRRGFGVQGSWPGVLMPLRIPIDHCLVSSEIAVHQRRLERVEGSDHCSLTVDFSVESR